MTDNENVIITGENCERIVRFYRRWTDLGDFHISHHRKMGSRRSERSEGRSKSLKRLKAGMKRRNSDPIRPENMGEAYIKRVMKEVDSQAPLNLSKAGKKV